MSIEEVRHEGVEGELLADPLHLRAQQGDLLIGDEPVVELGARRFLDAPPVDGLAEDIGIGEVGTIGVFAQYEIVESDGDGRRNAGDWGGTIEEVDLSSR